MMSVAQLLLAVRSSFGDMNAAQLSDDVIVSWVNAATKDILAAQPEVYEKTATGTIVSGTSITLPTDLVMLKDLRLGAPANKRKLVKVTFEQAESQFGPEDTYRLGPPTHYWIFGGVVHVYPAPDVAYALSVYYIRMPALADVAVKAAAIDVPYLYENRVVEYCLAQASKSDDNMSRAQYEQAAFEKGMDGLRDKDEAEELYYGSVTYLEEYDDFL